MRKKQLKDLFPPRDPRANKGTYKRLLIIGGSEEYPGSLLLATRAALLSGVGYVEVAYRGSRPEYLISSCPEAIYFNQKDLKNIESIRHFRSILFGNGLKPLDKELTKDFEFLMKNFEGRLIIDGSGFGYLLDYFNRFDERTVKPEIIILPHIKEFAALVGVPVSSSDPQTYRDKVETYLIDHPRTTVVLKSYQTLLKTTQHEYLLTVGNPGLAKAGSGDAQAGFIAGLLAYSPCFNIDTCRFGATVFGRAADLALQRCSSAALTASRVIDHLPLALKEYIL